MLFVFEICFVSDSIRRNPVPVPCLKETFTVNRYIVAGLHDLNSYIWSKRAGWSTAQITFRIFLIEPESDASHEEALKSRRPQYVFSLTLLIERSGACMVPGKVDGAILVGP